MITAATIVPTNDIPRRDRILFVFGTIFVLLVAKSGRGIEMTLPLLTAKVGCYSTPVSDYYQTMYLNIISNLAALNPAGTNT